MTRGGGAAGSSAKAAVRPAVSRQPPRQVRASAHASGRHAAGSRLKRVATACTASGDVIDSFTVDILAIYGLIADGKRIWSSRW